MIINENQIKMKEKGIKKYLRNDKKKIINICAIIHVFIINNIVSQFQMLSQLFSIA
jgi:hypothetical protein